MRLKKTIGYLLLTALAAFMGCSPDPSGAVLDTQPGTVDGGGIEKGPAGTMLPVARINGTPSSGDFSNCGNYTFTLAWTLPAREMDDPYNAEVLLGVYDTWLEYKELIQPLPYYKGIEGLQGFVPLRVFNSAGKLDNTVATAVKGQYGYPIIHRYWPKPAASDAWTEPKTRGEWLATEAVRVKAFKEDVKQLTAMMRDIKASPFYKDEFFESRLQNLYAEMADLIYYNPPETECKQREIINRIDIAGDPRKKSYLDPNVTGYLYEYYLGHAPPSSEYAASAPLAFPETGEEYWWW
jgi:hypothetical protein